MLTSSRLARRFALALLASTTLPTAAAWAQDTGSGEPSGTEANSQTDGENQEIIVTATKRAENLQDVPMAITAIGTEQLEDLQVNRFEDYARLVPSLSFKSGGGGGSADGPGTNNAYFRGVASGENANHSASLPSVGTYLDEQPVTTISGALDVHVFDIARIEALAGPQVTLYGASSQAGTVRIITNKPDTSGFKGGYDLQGSVLDGSGGYTAEGFTNIPLGAGERAAIRLVGWTQ